MFKTEKKVTDAYSKALIRGIVVTLVIIAVGVILAFASFVGQTINYAYLLAGTMTIGLGFGFVWGFIFGERAIIHLYSMRQSASKSLSNSFSTVQPTIYCSSCGAENSVEVNFCIKCGKKILKE